jgi:Alkaline phosphatase PhoX
MGNDHDGRGQHLSHAGHKNPRVDRGCEDASLSAVSQDETFAAVLQAFMSRRTLLKGAMTSLVLAYASPLTRYSTAAESKGFVPLTHSTEDKLLIPNGYQYDVIIRWGDPVFPDTPAFTTPAPNNRLYKLGNSAIMPISSDSCPCQLGARIRSAACWLSTMNTPTLN